LLPGLGKNTPAHYARTAIVKKNRYHSRCLLGMKAFSIFFEIGKTLMCPMLLQLAHQLTKNELLICSSGPMI
jgi:hypothetical protein